MRLEFGSDNKLLNSGGTTGGVNKHSYGIYTRKELVPERNDVSSGCEQARGCD